MERHPSPSASVFRAWAAAESDALVVVSGSGLDPRIRWVNRACAELLACAPQELIGQPFSALRRSLLRPGAAVPDREVLLDRVRTAERTLVCERRDGSPVRLDARALPLSDGGQPSWVVRLTPQADHARVRDDLRASQQRFRSLSERAPIGIFTSESGLRLGYVNDWFCHLVGGRADQLLGTDWMSERLTRAAAAARLLVSRPVAADQVTALLLAAACAQDAEQTARAAPTPGCPRLRSPRWCRPVAEAGRQRCRHDRPDRPDPVHGRRAPPTYGRPRRHRGRLGRSARSGPGGSGRRDEHRRRAQR